MERRQKGVLAVAGEAVEAVTAVAGAVAHQDKGVAKQEPSGGAVGVQQIGIEQLLEGLHQRGEVVSELVPMELQAGALAVPLWAFRSRAGV